MKVAVREVSVKGASTLIEWVDDSGNLNRAIVPSEEVSHDTDGVFVNDPDSGAPYGESWEDLVRAKAGPKGIANLLRQKGIWTYEDFLRNTAVVNSAFKEACSLNYQAFVDAVHSRQSTQEGKE